MMDPAETKASRDRNLLFGVLAVQLKFISPGDMARVAGLWAKAPDKEVGRILLDEGLIDPKAHQLISGMMDLRIAANSGDSTLALEDFGGNRAVHESFAAAVAPVDEPGAEGTLQFADDGEAVESFGGGGDIAIPLRTGPIRGAEFAESEQVTLEHPGRYSVKGEHGRGAIGRVLVAFDEHIGREVALKELLPEGGSFSGSSSPGSRHTAAATARFLREARITGQLEHPGIVPVYEIAKRADGSSYYTMKLVRGRTLSDKLREVITYSGGANAAEMSERLKLLSHFLDLCQAMAYAHSKGVIHRDLKPANVMVGEFGETVALDWGLAKVRGLADVRADDIEKGLELIKQAGAGETVKGVPIGTPSYMSPEQAEGRVDDIDERSDVWSLGAILHEILTGRPPFTGTTAWEVMGKVVGEEVTPIGEVEEYAPPELCAIAHRCLTKDKDKRYANAGELADDVAAFQAGGIVSSYEYSMGTLARRFLRKQWPIAATLAAAAVAMMALGYFAVGKIQAKEEAARKNLGDIYLMMGQQSESAKDYDKAEVFYATALTKADADETRHRLNYARSRPEIKGRLLSSLAGHQDSVTVLALSPDGKALASGANDRAVKLWDTASGRLLFTLDGHRGYVKDVRFSTDGKLLASAGADGAVMVWDPATGTRLHALTGHTGIVESIAFAPDGKSLVSASWDHTLKIWDTASGELRHTLAGHHGWVRKVLIAPDGRTVVSASGDRTIRLWDLETGQPRTVLSGPKRDLETMAISADGSRLAGADWDRMVTLWDLDTGSIIHSLAGHKDIVKALAFAPDGKTLVSAGADKIINVWDTQTGGLLFSLSGHTRPVEALAVGLQGRVLVSAGRDATVKIWHLPTGVLIRTINGQENAVRALAFSPESGLLAAGGDDAVIKLWDAGPSQIFTTLYKEQHPEWIGVVAFDEEGKPMAAGGDESPVKLDYFSAVKQDPPDDLLAESERGTGLRVDAMEADPWDPDSGYLAAGPPGPSD